MLSFMRDQQEGNQAKAQAQAEPSRQASPPDYLPAAGRPQQTQRSNLAVIILFAVGLAALAVMVKKCQPTTAAAAPTKSEESQIEAAIGQLTGVSAEMTSRMDQIMQRFHEFSAVAQVAVDELAKNPFEQEAASQRKAASSTALPAETPAAVPQTRVEVQVQAATPPAAPAPAATATPAETADQAAARLAAEEARHRLAEDARTREEARQRQAEEAKRLAAEEAKRRQAEQAMQQHQQQVRHVAMELKLQSILQSGPESRCLIDDTLVRVGDRIKGFEVLKIEEAWVHLKWSEPPMPDMMVVLKLSE